MTYSAPLDGRSEYVGVFPIVVTELEFRDIERQVFPAYLVERADHAVLNLGTSGLLNLWRC